MPKERKTRSVSFERHSRASPFLSRSPDHQHRTRTTHGDPHASSSVAISANDVKEWDEVRCPVCMEHPHNAVLLMCSSRNKGCRPFMCDTSYRHSNCLDQFKKSPPGLQTSSENSNGEEPKSPKNQQLLCPLCRGSVSGWMVMESARNYMNAKVRSCSKETCEYSGVYCDLRRHARSEHPSVRPAVSDPDRVRDWRRMELQREMGDLLSILQSAIGPRYASEDVGHGSFPESFVSILLVLRIPDAPTRRARSLRSPWRYIGRQRRGSSSRRRGGGIGVSLWGEPLSDVTFSDLDVEEEEDRAEGGTTSPAPSRNTVRGPGRSRRQLRLSDDEDELP